MHDNNRPNTCLDPEDAVCDVPQGTGILILAADDNTVLQNEVTGNDSYGIAVSNFCVGTGTPPEICAQLDIQPDADGNHITDNVVTGNGEQPGSRPAAGVRRGPRLGHDRNGQLLVEQRVRHVVPRPTARLLGQRPRQSNCGGRLRPPHRPGRPQAA